jgi:hypothetical protein
LFRPRRLALLAPAVAILSALAAPGPAGAAGTKTLKSRPDLKPTLLKVVRRFEGRAPGLIFITPRAATPSQRTGPMIVDDWARARFLHLPGKGQSSSNFEVQRYRGQPVMTWSERPPIGAAGIYGGDSKRMFNAVMDSSYRVIRKVQAKGAGVYTDLHDFEITPRNTALVLGYRFVRRDLRRYGFSERAAVIDCIVQEIDLTSGKVLLNWRALDHVPLSDSTVKITPKKAWDYFHLNSVAVDSDGQLLLSARHTSTVYKISRRKGQVLWRLGGKRSMYKMGRNTGFWFQHDARLLPNGLLSIFDNGAADFDRSHHKQSRVIYLRLDRKKRTATLARGFYHPSRVLAISQGNAQTLPNGNLFVGWGSSPAISEFSPDGRMLWDARVPNGRYQSYRAFREPWVGRPTRPPALAASASGGTVNAYASWNGSTEVQNWRLLGGASASTLKPLTTVRWNGLETRVSVPSSANVVQVQALDARGRVLSSSGVATVAR